MRPLGKKEYVISKGKKKEVIIHFQTAIPEENGVPHLSTQVKKKKKCDPRVLYQV